MKLDLSYHFNFAALFAPDTEPDVLYENIGRNYFPSSSQRALSAIEYRFCAEGNGITATLAQQDSARLVAYYAMLGVPYEYTHFYPR